MKLVDYHYDIVILGAGIAGLFIANLLKMAGYNILLIEKEQVGGVQTLASQGMIHGGQKYAIHGKSTHHTTSIAEMPMRWDACFEGKGEVDLSKVRVLSDHQLIFPAGGFFSRLAIFAAARAVRGRTEKLKKELISKFLKQGPVYKMSEKVIDIKSLIEEISSKLQGRIFQGNVEEIDTEGYMVVSGVPIKAEMVIVTAGAGNELILKLLGVTEKRTQRRPLRQIMVKPLPESLYGHGIVGHPKPRITVTSYPVSDSEYIWYLGGSVAEKSISMSKEKAIQFAKAEMKNIFPEINWDEKEWATWEGDRAEPFDGEGVLPPGPCIEQYGNVFVAWPTKLTFVPALADKIMEKLAQNAVLFSEETKAPPFKSVTIGHCPWEGVKWQKV